MSAWPMSRMSTSYFAMMAMKSAVNPGRSSPVMRININSCCISWSCRVRKVFNRFVFLVEREKREAVFAKIRINLQASNFSLPLFYTTGASWAIVFPAYWAPFRAFCLASPGRNFASGMGTFAEALFSYKIGDWLVCCCCCCYLCRAFLSAKRLTIHANR